MSLLCGVTEKVTYGVFSDRRQSLNTNLDLAQVVQGILVMPCGRDLNPWRAFGEGKPDRGNDEGGSLGRGEYNPLSTT